MAPQGICAYAERVSSDTFDAASPRTSIPRTTANRSMRSRSRSSRTLPSMNAATDSPASIMCCTRMRSSARMLHGRRSQDVIAEVAGEISRGPQVDDTTTKELGQLGLHLREGDESGCRAGLELDEEVDVAVGARRARH